MSYSETGAHARLSGENVVEFDLDFGRNPKYREILEWFSAQSIARFDLDFGRGLTYRPTLVGISVET